MAGILNIGVSALQTYQRALNTTGHNVANSDTEGYSRQRTLLETREPTFLGGVGWLGSGVRVSSVERMYDDFVATQMRNAQSAASSLETVSNYASRLDNLLADPIVGLDTAMQNMFDAMQTLSDEPSSMAARQLVTSEIDSLADRFRYLDRQYDDLRLEVNQQLSTKVEDLNALAQSIGRINNAIVQATGQSGGNPPNDMLDDREVLLTELSKLVDVTVVAQDDGALNVFVGKGQALVISGNANTFSITANPAEVAKPNISITNINGSQVIDDQITGGELGGLLEFRENFVHQGQSQLGLVAAGLVTSMNIQHQLGIDINGNLGGNVFQPLSFTGEVNQNNTGTAAVTMAVSNTGISDLTSSDYTLTYDGANYTMVRESDGSTVYSGAAASFTADGLTVNVSAGAAAGDSFLLKPMRDAAGNVNQVLTDPNMIAAGSPVVSGEVKDANGGALNTGNAEMVQLTNTGIAGIPYAADMVFTYSANADGGGNPGFVITNGPGAPNNYVLYDPSTSDVSGKTFPVAANPNQFAAFGDVTFTIRGTPAVGDALYIGNNTNGTADNRNIAILANLQNDKVMLQGAASFQETYSRLVTDVGSKAHNAEVNFQAQEGLLLTHQETLASISGVNLDEEAANLVKYQQAYQAAAQVITVANSLFDTLIGAVRR